MRQSVGESSTSLTEKNEEIRTMEFPKLRWDPPSFKRKFDGGGERDGEFPFGEVSLPAGGGGAKKDSCNMKTAEVP